MGDEWLRIGGLKLYLDGTLGSQTAHMLSPFEGLPGNTGLPTLEAERFTSMVSKAADAGLATAVHAIGDAANRVALDGFENVLRRREERDDPLLMRIEHAQVLDAGDVDRFADLGVIASMQPYHAIDDGRWVEKVIGPERVKGTYAFRSLLDAKAALAFGSDWSVAPPTPLEGIYAAVTRRTLDGKNPDGWVPEQKISVEEALRAYTRTAAFASFEEERKGRLTVGRLADFAILSRDLFSIPPEQIREVEVDLTVVGGKIVHERSGVTP